MKIHGSHVDITPRVGAKRALEKRDGQDDKEQLCPLKKMLKKCQEISQARQIVGHPSRASVIASSSVGGQPQQHEALSAYEKENQGKHLKFC